MPLWQMADRYFTSSKTRRMTIQIKVRKNQHKVKKKKRKEKKRKEKERKEKRQII